MSHRRLGPPRSAQALVRRLGMVGGLLVALALIAPTPTAAHALSGNVNAPLPLAAYLTGAAIAVALSFLFVFLSDPRPAKAPTPERIVVVPRWLRLGLRGVGLLGWLWIMVQAIIGGSNDADVASLFLWVYGWVGIALLSAVIGPIWQWLDPFTTLHDLGGLVVRRLGLRGWNAAPLPGRLRSWPAIAGLSFFIWLELAAAILGGRPLAIILFGYTVLTLTGMIQYGRDEWRRYGETFSCWFGILNRMAPLELVGDPSEGRLRRRPFGSGLLVGNWSRRQLLLVALATGAILYDGLAQTQLFFDLFGLVSLPMDTLLLALVLGGLAGVILLLARRIGTSPLAAGLVPVATGYLLAHYLTALLIDGQRILIAVSDPFQLGWDLFGTAFYEPAVDWIPTSLVWSAQLVAVVGGHILGAWAGHAASFRQDGRTDRMRQLPLALLMVALTTATLWSLGQGLVFISD